MNDPAFSIPVEANYIEAIGRAAYNFAYLEWGVVWLIEVLEPGFLAKVGALTAGEIAKKFVNVAASLPPSVSDRDQLRAAAAAFTDLVIERNRLLHGTPYTADGGEQRLQYSGKSGEKDWTRDRILQAALDFEKLSIEINPLFHGGRYDAYQAAKRQP